MYVCVACDKKSATIDFWIRVKNDPILKKRVKRKDAKLSKLGWPGQGKEASNRTKFNGKKYDPASDTYNGGCSDCGSSS